MDYEIKPPSFRDVLVIQVLGAVTVNSRGEKVRSFEDENTRRGAVVPFRGDEHASSQQVVSEATHEVWLRYYDMTTQKRVKKGTRIFNVLAVQHLPNEVHHWTKLVVKETS